MLANVSAKEYKFQSTLPAGGATYEVFTALCKLLISIHAPRGGSDFNLTNKQAKVLDISIHAPRGGSDFMAICALVISFIFQSTLPAGGATSSGTRCVPLVCISIHAPRGGSDWAGRRCRRSGLYFNPRSPRGERLFSGTRCVPLVCISIHAPRGGSDKPHADRVAHLIVISIHAPRGGSDLCGGIHHRKSQSKISIHAPRGGSDGKDYQKLAKNLCRFP